MKQLHKLLLLIIALVGAYNIILPKMFVEQHQFTSLKEASDMYKRQNANNIITVEYGGGLGNSIWEFMSLLAFMRLYENKLNFSAYIPVPLREKVEYVFERINVQEIAEIPETFLKEGPYILDINENFKCNKLLGKTRRTFILPRYSARYEEIIQYGIDKVKKEFRFRKHYIEHSYKLFDKIKAEFKISQKNVTFIGMHYRGTDYIQHLKKIYKSFMGPPNSTFYIKAMNYFKKKYETVVFILITIDFQWLYENLPFIQKNNNLVVNPNGIDLVKDMTLLSHCNHSIINYGTFGTTGALFAGGTTFVYNLGIPIDHRGPTIAVGIAKILSNWHVDK